MQRTLNYPFEDLGATCLIAAQTIRNGGFEAEAVMAAADMVETARGDICTDLTEFHRGDDSTHDTLISSADILLAELQGEEWSDFASVADAYEAVGKLLEAAGRL